MEFKEPFKLLENLPKKLNNFYTKRSRSSLIITNKSKNKKNFNPVLILTKPLRNILDY